MNNKKCLIDESNKKEIIYNLINAGLAGGLVLLGSLASGEITIKGICAALVASGIIMISKFKEYWDGEKGEYTTKLFNFIQV